MFIKQGSTYNFTESIESVNALPSGVYNIAYDYNKAQLTFIRFADNFKLPNKFYGLDKNISTTLSKYKRSKSSVGALFTGLKGSGKTLATKIICNTLQLPVIIVSDIYEKEVYDTLFSQLGNNPSIVLFDEFEKVFNKDEQEKLLSVLDGHYDAKHLFLFTSNTTYASEFLTNRPSRICYNFQYKGLDISTIREICDDYLEKKESQKDLEEFSKKFPQSNIDLLMSLIDEINNTDNSLEEILYYMNITLEPEIFQFRILKNGETVGKGTCNSPWVLSSVEFYDKTEEKWNEVPLDSKLLKFENDKITHDGSEYYVEFYKENNRYGLSNIFK